VGDGGSRAHGAVGHSGDSHAGDGGDSGARRLPLAVVYHHDYDLSLGDHVFPSIKYRLFHDEALRSGLAAPADFVAPEPATDDDIRLVHTADWTDRLKNLQLTYSEILHLEIPVSPALVTALWLACGGSILAARRALVDGGAFNVGGGLHHAFPGHGEGFCGLNDVAVAIRRLQKDGAIRRAMVVDLDVHQGNGTAGVFAADPDVFTISLHQEDNYPYIKPPSSIDVGLPDGLRDAEYHRILRETLDDAYARFTPDLVAYVAGADPYERDRLGGLKLTMAGLEERDRIVLGAARRRGLPFFVTLAGGYATDVADTVAIHLNSLRVAAEALAAGPEAAAGLTPSGSAASPGASPTP
jgi:acetoin utilization deacetylase AcuC-like enzyme